MDYDSNDHDDTELRILGSRFEHAAYVLGVSALVEKTLESYKHYFSAKSVFQKLRYKRLTPDLFLERYKNLRSLFTRAINPPIMPLVSAIKQLREAIEPQLQNGGISFDDLRRIFEGRATSLFGFWRQTREAVVENSSKFISGNTCLIYGSSSLVLHALERCSASQLEICITPTPYQMESTTGAEYVTKFQSQFGRITDCHVVTIDVANSPAEIMRKYGIELLVLGAHVITSEGGVITDRGADYLAKEVKSKGLKVCVLSERAKLSPLKEQLLCDAIKEDLSIRDNFAFVDGKLIDDFITETGQVKPDHFSTLSQQLLDRGKQWFPIDAPSLKQ